jgi:amino acid transporter
MTQGGGTPGGSIPPENWFPLPALLLDVILPPLALPAQGEVRLIALLLFVISFITNIAFGPWLVTYILSACAVPIKFEKSITEKTKNKSKETRDAVPFLIFTICMLYC